MTNTKDVDRSFYNEISDGTNFIISFGNNPKKRFGSFAKGYFLAASQMAEHLIAKWKTWIHSWTTGTN